MLEDDTGLDDIFTNYIVSGRSEMADVSFSGPVQFMPNGAVDPNSDYSRIGQPNRGRTPRRTLTVGYTPRASVSVEVGIRANNITPIEGGRAFRYHARMFCMMRTAQDHRHDVIHVPVPVTLGGENVTLGGEQVFI